jgi:hypothetical protein
MSQENVELWRASIRQIGDAICASDPSRQARGPPIAFQMRM